MYVSRRQATKTLGALLLAPIGFAQSERQYDLELIVSSDESDKPIKFPLKGNASQVRRDYNNLKSTIPFIHLDNHLWFVASYLASDPYYFAANFESHTYGTPSERGFTDKQFFARFNDEHYFLRLELDGIVSIGGLVLLNGMRRFSINDGYLDKDDQYGYLRQGDENSEQWWISKPIELESNTRD